MKHPLLPAVIAALLCLAAPSFAATTNVAYGGATLTFRPSNLTINAGDTVIWTNASGVHNVVGDTPGTSLCGCAGTSIPGYTNTFTIPGDYLYHCSFHVSFGMTGIVHVVSTPATPAMLTNATAFTNGSFVFTILSTANHTNIIQASTNLASASSWVALATNFPGTNMYNFTDATVNLFPNRFYRVVQP